MKTSVKLIPFIAVLLAAFSGLVAPHCFAAEVQGKIDLGTVYTQTVQIVPLAGLKVYVEHLQYGGNVNGNGVEVGVLYETTHDSMGLLRRISKAESCIASEKKSQVVVSCESSQGFLIRGSKAGLSA